MHKHSVFTGLFLIMAGIIVILVNLGYGSWDLLWQIWRLWPLLIIFIGIRVIWQGPSSEWFVYGFWLLVALGVIVLLLMNPKANFSPTMSQDFTRIAVNRIDYPGVTTGKATINFGGGQLTLGSDTGQLLEGNFGGFPARTSVKSLQNTLMVNLQQTGSFSRHWWRHDFNWNNEYKEDKEDKDRSNHDYRWDIQLSPALNWNIGLQTGGIKGEADLSDIPVRELNLKMGAGDFSLILGGKSSQTLVNIKAGASQIKIKVPRGSGVKVKLTGALVKNNLKDLGWTLENQSYFSPGYDKTAKHLDIDLNMAVGNFELAE